MPKLNISEKQSQLYEIALCEWGLMMMVFTYADLAKREIPPVNPSLGLNTHMVYRRSTETGVPNK